MKPRDILKRYELKSTGCREGILSVLLKGNEAYSENEIKTKLNCNYDRTTFYRSLKTLSSKGIIHCIAADKQAIKYALNINGSRGNEHLHFHCLHCNNVQCLDTGVCIELNLPAGFKVSETELIVKGICPKCQRK